MPIHCLFITQYRLQIILHVHTLITFEMTSYLITGTSRGIGLELARQLVESNAEITIFAAARSTTAPGFQQLLERHPTQIIHVPLEVTSEDSIKAAVSLVSSKLNGKGLDVLINNAGVLKSGRLEDM